MIRKSAAWIAGYILKYYPESNFEVLVFGYEILIQEICLVAMALILSVLFDVFFLMLINIVVFSVMRKFAGGVHANTHFACTASYLAYLFAVIALSQCKAPMLMIALLYVANVTLLLLFAPADTAEMPIVKHICRRKIYSIVILSGLYLLGVVLLATYPPLGRFSYVLFYCPTIVCVLTHPLVYAVYKCKKSTGMSNG